MRQFSPMPIWNAIPLVFRPFLSKYVAVGKFGTRGLMAEEGGGADDAIGAPAVEVGTSYFKQLYLYAFASQPEVIAHLRMQATSEEMKRSNEILAAWSALQPQVQALVAAEGGVAETVTVTEIPAAHMARVAEILSN